MKDLNDIDPLPKLPRAMNGAFSVHKDGRVYTLPESNRQKEEWKKAIKEADGEDWVQAGKDLYRNSRGQMKYTPPEPDAEIGVLVSDTGYEIFWPPGVPVEPWVEKFNKDVEYWAKHEQIRGFEHFMKLSNLREIYA